MRERMVKRVSKKQKKILIVLIVLVAVLTIITALRSRVINSYQVSETATVTRPTRLSRNLYGFGHRFVFKGQTLPISRYYLMGVGRQRVVAQVGIRGRRYYVNANHLQLQQTNAVNQYLAKNNYPHTRVTEAIDRQFSKQSYQTWNRRPRGVIVHDTGTENTTVASESRYMENNYANSGIFVHTFISSDKILNIANVNYMAQGAGPNANPYFVQFEMPHQYKKRSFALQVGNAAYYTAKILRDNRLAVTEGGPNKYGTVWTHAMVSAYLGGTDHRDPNEYWTTSANQLFDSGYDVGDFVELVQAYYNRM